MKNKSLLIFIIFLSIGLKAQNPITLNLPNPCSITSVIEPTTNRIATFDFTVSPNPTPGTFVLEISAPDVIGHKEILISNMHGAKLITEQFYSSHKTCVKTINISQMPDGIYTITIIGMNDKRSKKIVLHKN